MPDSKSAEAAEPHARCRNLVWESSPDNEGSVPGRYCVSRLGTIQSMDCPVYQGQTCCLFDPREPDEQPEVADEERILEVRGQLTSDYLRWSYWKRIDALRAEEPPPVKDELPDIEVELPQEVEADGESEEVERHEIPAPPPKEEALKEKYPGQRRSEDRRRSRQPAASEDPAAEEDDFTRGIFELPSLDPEAEPEVEPDVATPPPEESSGADPAGDEKKPADSPARRRPRRRSRRRRGGKRGQGSTDQKPSK